MDDLRALRLRIRRMMLIATSCLSKRAAALRTRIGLDGTCSAPSLISISDS
jgi:hypothetical protein